MILFRKDVPFVSCFEISFETISWYKNRICHHNSKGFLIPRSMYVNNLLENPWKCSFYRHSRYLFRNHSQFFRAIDCSLSFWGWWIKPLQLNHFIYKRHVIFYFRKNYMKFFKNLLKNKIYNIYEDLIKQKLYFYTKLATSSAKIPIWNVGLVQEFVLGLLFKGTQNV